MVHGKGFIDRKGGLKGRVVSHEDGFSSGIRSTVHVTLFVFLSNMNQM